MFTVLPWPVSASRGSGATVIRVAATTIAGARRLSWALASLST